MDIIDKIRFEPEPVAYEPEEVSDAYKLLFNENNPAAKIVLQDLMRKANYGSNAIPIESTMKYYYDGMCNIIDSIKVGINKIVVPDEHLTSEDDEPELLI